MTRINLIEPKHLTKRHLVAEYKEITQFVHLVGKRVRSNKSFEDIPKEYTLNRGHCLFFYNKGQYILDRLCKLRMEMLLRNINIDYYTFKQKYDRILDNYSEDLMNNYIPTKQDYSIVIDRIQTRISEKPQLYPDAERFLISIPKYI